MIPFTLRKSALAAFFITLALAPARVARAGEEACDARALYEHARELHAQRQYEAALQEYRAAYRCKPHFVVLAGIGDVQFQLGLYVESAATLKRFLDEGGDSVPAPRRLATEQRREVAESRIARLEVTTRQPGAVIEVDGNKEGRTPASLPLNPGIHEVTVGHEGAPSVTQTIELARGEQRPLRLVLPSPPPPSQGVLVVDCPDAGELLLDGERISQPRATAGLNLDPGFYQVAFTTADGTRHEKSVEIRANRTASVSCISERPQRSDLPPDLDPDPRSRSWMKTSGYVALGAGAAFGVAAVGVAVRNNSRYAEYDRKWASYDPDNPDEKLEGEVETLGDAVKQGNTATAGLAVAGGVFTAAGVVLVVLNPTIRKESSPSAARRRGQPGIAIGEHGARFLTWSSKW